MSDINKVLGAGNKDLKGSKAIGQAQGQAPTSSYNYSNNPKDWGLDFSNLGQNLMDKATKDATNAAIGTMTGNSKAGYTGVPDADTIAKHQSNTETPKTNIMGFNIPGIGSNTIDVGNIMGKFAQRGTAPREKFALEKNPAGPTVETPQGLDWKKLLLTIGDAMAGGFAGAAGQKYNSVGMQQALQRQANEQKQKEFEAQKEAQRQALSDQTAAQEYLNAGQRQDNSALEQARMEFQEALENAKLRQSAQIANQDAANYRMKTIIGNSKAMAIMTNPEWSQEKKNALLQAVKMEDDAEFKKMQAQGVTNLLNGGK